MKKRISFLLLGLWGWVSIQAQDLGNSPYSQLGIGDLFSPAFSHQLGMGSTGASYTLPIFINNINPALLVQNRRTVLDAGVLGQLKELTETNGNQRDFAGTLGHLALAFPISQRLTTSVGVTPYSSVSFENNFIQDIQNSDFEADITSQGTGGLTSVFIAGGYDLLGGKSFRKDTLAHRLALGLRVNYLFGSITNESISRVNTGQLGRGFTLNFFQRENYRNFVFEPSLAYSRRLGSKYRFNLGFIYQLEADLRRDQFVSLNRDQLDPDITVSDFVDTLSTDGRADVTLPARYTAGISLEKLDERSGFAKWVFSADVSYQDWGVFEGGEAGSSLAESFSGSFGIQYIPNFTSIKKGFWRRTVYRAGFNFTRTPYSISGQDIDDLSVSAGFSIPFGRSGSSLNMSFIAGQRGTLSEGLVREQYLRAAIGITINDTWFVKPKFD